MNLMLKKDFDCSPHSHSILDTMKLNLKNRSECDNKNVNKLTINKDNNYFDNNDKNEIINNNNICQNTTDNDLNS